VGTKGHEDTVDYIYKHLTAPELKDYYNVTIQKFNLSIQESGTGSLFVNNLNTTITVAEYSPSGNVTAELVVVSNLGCNAVSILSSQRHEHVIDTT
jgi:hypothetical protein